MLKEARMDQIMQLLERDGSVEVANLCTLFQVTTMTIRRDLDELEQAGKIMRIHGGATIAQKSPLLEPPLSIRASCNMKLKSDIAKCAASLVDSGSKLFIGSGSTVSMFASALDSTLKLLIVTDAINIAYELSTRQNVNLVIVGGELRSNTLSTTGIFTENMLRQFKFELAFVGVTGIDSHGNLYLGSMAEIGIFKVLLENSKNVYILADASKLDTDDIVSVGQMDRRFTLITNNSAPADLLKSYEELGTTVITC